MGAAAMGAALGATLILPGLGCTQLLAAALGPGVPSASGCTNETLRHRRLLSRQRLPHDVPEKRAPWLLASPVSFLDAAALCRTLCVGNLLRLSLSIIKTHNCL